MRQHVGHPAGRSAIDCVNATQRAAGDDLLDFLIMRSVSMLMADDGFGTGFFEQVTYCKQLSAGQGYGLFESDEPGATVNRRLDEGRAQMRHGAETKYVRPDLPGQG